MRFHERVGLLSPAHRASNGYRQFDPSALEELAFINRAKGIGMTLEEIAELQAASPNSECQVLQARRRAFVFDRIDEVRGQLGEFTAFEQQLRTASSRLSARDPRPERCGKGCGCEVDIDVRSDAATLNPQPWGCSQEAAELGVRIAEWRALASVATSLERIGRSERSMTPVWAGCW